MAQSTLIPSAVAKVLRLPQFKWRVRTPGTVTALEVDGQVLRVAQTVQRMSRAAVTRVAIEPLELPAEADRTDPAVLGQAVAQALGKLRLSPGAVVMGVPRAQVLLRSLTLPWIKDLRELASMVHLQVGKDLPFSLEEAVIDFQVTRQLEASEAAAPDGTPASEPKVEVLVAAIKAEVVEFYQKLAEAAGVKLAAVGWHSYANARCLEACRVAEDEKAVGLVTLRPDEMGIDVVARQRLLFSRGTVLKHAESAREGADRADESVPAAGEAGVGTVAAPENFVHAVVIEAVRSLHSYGSLEPRNPVAKLAVCGVTGQEDAVVAALQARLNLRCAKLDLAAALDLPEEARAHAPDALAAIGLALGAQDAQGLPFDFLNPKRPAVRRNLQRIRLVMGVAAGLAALLFVFGVQTKLKKQREAAFIKLKAELDAAMKMRNTYTRMRRQASTLQNWSKDGKNWLEHLGYLSAILPKSEEVYLTSISVGSQGTIKLAVQARSGRILAEMEKQLRAAGYEVKPSAVNPVSDKTGYNFRSSVELVPGKMKINLATAHPPPRPLDDISLEGGRPGRRGGSRE